MSAHQGPLARLPSHVSLAPLTTPRLALEPLVEAHAEVLFAGFADPALHTFIPTNPPVSVDSLRERYRRLEGRTSPDGQTGWLNWAARWRDEQAYVGYFQATVHPDSTADLAYLVFAPHTRRGLGVEGAGAVVAHLFAERGVSVITARIDTRNEASARLVRRLGFTHRGVVTGADFFKGSSSDEDVFDLDPERFAQWAPGGVIGTSNV